MCVSLCLYIVCVYLMGVVVVKFCDFCVGLFDVFECVEFKLVWGLFVDIFVVILYV